jgi:hypothetical protein
MARVVGKDAEAVIRLYKVFLQDLGNGLSEMMSGNVKRIN